MIPPEPIFRILFVCTGNTCRSPMAAAALAHELGTEGARVEVASAGTAAWEGQPATEGAIEVANGDGIDLGAHRCRRVTPVLVRGADLVLVMDREQLSGGQALGAE